MSELGDKIRASVERLKAFEPEEGYYLAFSGGKDSVVCKALMDMAGVKYHAHYRVTSVDPPELVRFIRERYKDVQMEIPHYLDGSPVTMWNLILRKMMPPTRFARFCCQYLKEDAGIGNMTVTGVRWAESAKRKQNQGLVTVICKKDGKDLEDVGFQKNNSGGYILTNDNVDARRMLESCYKRKKTVLNIIIDWEDLDVWNFIRGEGIPYCSLYDDGLYRIGCIGCPMSHTKKREHEFARWPKYREMYLRTFDRMLKLRIERNKKNPDRPVWRAGGVEWKEPSAQDVFNWWMEYPVLPGQMTFDDFELEDEDDEEVQE